MRPLRYVSVCSGIEAATVAWHPLGWVPLMFAEIAKFPSRVLTHHYPQVPNAGDFTTIRDVSGVDLLVGGTPCQSFSLAGLRGGLADDRGNLALEFCRLADRLRPRWLLWENVPGVLSSNGGRDFGSILGALGELGYGFAYRILDAQFFGVPQRRRRVFVVGHLGDWRRAAAVLFERESLRGNSAPRRAQRHQVAGTLGVGIKGGFGGDLDRCGAFIPVGVSGGISHTLKGEGFDASEDGTGRGVPVVAFSQNSRDEVRTSDVMPALTSGGGKPEQGYPAVAFHATQSPISGPLAPALGANGANGVYVPPVSYALTCHAAKMGDPTTERRSCPLSGRVRKLTPRECERLQGFPDDYTLVDWPSRASKAKIENDVFKYFLRSGLSASEAEAAARHPDSARYHALGNSMAVPCMAWIGKRIAQVEVI